MIIFYFLVLVGVIGDSLESENIPLCWNTGTNYAYLCWEDKDPGIPLEDYRKNIYVRLEKRGRLFCPIITNLNIVDDSWGEVYYELTCMRETDASFQGCDVYKLFLLKRIYISALLSALPDKLGSQDWKDKVTDIFEGLQRPQDYLKDAGGFWKNVTKSQDWLGNVKKYFTGIPTDPICEEEKQKEDKGDDNNVKVRKSAYRPAILQIVLLCLAAVLILAVCSFFLWRWNKKRQRNLEIGGASDRDTAGVIQNPL
ncbi:uncharacterized protein LOC120924702 isoform X2 [Rana temporaria]|uniref:uncharacterized protein LOC120924702 isoform X2 n=1 Tax=Rana temporaria TaxID=8407 RepID=UPI001AAC5E0E|nr:uncharacterized protein LOC120924702 isoform X2 [Rana temporaria]